MKSHHKHHKAGGGKVEPEVKTLPYNAQGSHVEKEAEEKKRGGRAKHHMHGEGEKKHHRLDRKATGGAVKAFARGGKVGSDRAPLTSAANLKNARGHDAEDSGNASDGP